MENYNPRIEESSIYFIVVIGCITEDSIRRSYELLREKWVSDEEISLHPYLLEMLP